MAASIYHEKQEGQLCGVHCLNALLQGPYFTEVDLMEIAHKLDAAEKKVMAEMGTDTTDFVKYAAEDSGNVNDSGFFSIQVLSEALKVWDLECVSLNSPEMEYARANPCDQPGYICNLHEHWYTIRRFGPNRIWFDINSMHNAAEHISDTYMSLLLEQLRQQGYSIFVIKGNLPQCEADMMTEPPPRLPAAGAKQALTEEQQMEAAIAASIMSAAQETSKRDVDVDDMRAKRLARFK
eukprot:GFYU01006773.1.p1 GENE.GFYU01006773.1~~GFYU01006773.1.p1  ORF type:complete len:237 (+),score=55.19 GFYU01006773.1:43-753(+)